jgi:hypothetical protein
VNWDAVGAVAELLGGAATVATLAYLAVQIRQAAAATRAQIRQAMADGQIHYVNSRAIDPFLRRVTLKAILRRELDQEESYGLQVHLVAHLRLFENHFAQYTLGTLDEEDWRAQRELLKGLFRIEAYRQAYSFLGDVCNSEFAAEVERILAETREAAVS